MVIMDMEVVTANWNLHGHNVDVIYPTGLHGGKCIAEVADDMELGAKGL